MKNFGQDKQTAQPKNGTAIQNHSKTNSNSLTDKMNILEKVSERDRKDKKIKTHQNRLECQKRSTWGTGSNTEPLFGKQRKDLSHITCFSRNEKGYHSKNCIKPKTKN